MSKITREFQEEVELWVARQFALIPTGLVAQAHRAYENSASTDDDCCSVLELVASPTKECLNCGETFELCDVEDWWIYFTCNECDEEFIVSERNLEGNRHCPECGSENVAEGDYKDDGDRELTTPCCERTSKMSSLGVGNPIHE